MRWHLSIIAFYVLIVSISELCLGVSECTPTAQQWQGDYYDENSMPQYQAAMAYVKNLDLSKFSNILDIGCGSGKITEVIALKAPSAQVEGIDASESMIKTAREKYRGVGNLRFETRNAEKLDYPEKFDFIFSSACLHWVKDKEAAFNGIAKALKPGGLLLVTATAKAFNHPLVRAFLALKSSEPWSSLLKHVDPTSQQFPLEKYETEKLLRGAGLEPLEIHEVMQPLCFNSKKALGAWLLGWLGGLSSIASFPQDKQQLFIDALVEEYARLVPTGKHGSIEFVCPYIVFKALKPINNKTLPAPGDKSLEKIKN